MNIVMFLRRLFSSFAEPLNQPNDLIGCLQQTQQQQKSLRVSNNFSNATPSLDSLLWLYEVAPCFPLKSDRVHVINEPQHFYETLMELGAKARNRIVLASLYLGTGQLETRFVQTIRTSLMQQSTLRVNVLLDFTRGTRGEINSKTMLMPLVRDFSEQVQLSLYHTPNLRGLTKRLIPPRWNELVGLQHMKVYLFDDVVLISGANLSHDYFTNRQDRYILIEDKPLADFYAELISRVQEFSLAVQKDSAIGLHPKWKLLPYEGAKSEFIQKARERIISLIQDVYRHQQEALLNPTESTAAADSWIFPLIEMGQIGIHHDSIVTKRLLCDCVSGSRLKFATGYFNLTKEYMDILMHKSSAQCSILMAHPNANGFQGAKGPAGGIPAAYSLIAKSFYENLVRYRQEKRVNFFEYEKQGWTYHAKGLWYYLPLSSLPNLTLIGSSNFGERSVHRDLETQICLITANRQLSERLQAENERLFNLSSTAERQIATRPVPRWVQAVVRIFRNFF